MRKLTIVVTGLVALVAASVAVAHGIEGARSAAAVSASFSATASSAKTRTCTTTDNKTITVTDARYTGTASGSADLTGALTLRARSVVNTTDKVGSVDGSFRIEVAQGRATTGSFSAVYSDGTIAGLAVGQARQPGARLVANLSAAFAPGTSFTNGKLGGTSGGGAVELAAGPCKPQQSHPEHSQASGTIAALSSSSITVANLTCSIPASSSAAVASRFKQGDRVVIRCSYANGQSTLDRIDKR